MSKLAQVLHVKELQRRINHSRRIVVPKVIVTLQTNFAKTRLKHDLRRGFEDQQVIAHKVMIIQPHDIMSDDFIARMIIIAPEQGFYLLQPLTKDVLLKILADMLFALPVQQGVMTYLPNPLNRFCLDLRGDRINWFRSRKMRSVLSQFSLVIKRDLREDLMMASRYHHG